MINQSPTTAQIAPRLISWDILEECLTEAAFLWAQWEHALVSCDYILQEVAELEERLRARLDMLVLGGAPADRRLLRPALEGEEREGVSAAALALLMEEGNDPLDFLLSRIQSGTALQRTAICRALEVCEREGMEARLIPLLQRGTPTVQADLLDVLTARRVRPECSLEQLFSLGTPPLQAAVLRAAGRVPLQVAPSLLDEGLRSSEPAVRDAALEAGLVLGHRAAWTACVELVSCHAPTSGLAMLMLALGGSEDDVRRLLGALSVPELRRDALWALGFSGRRAAAEACLPWMRDDRLSKPAGEAFSAITGLSLRGEFVLEEPLTPEEPIPLEEEEFDARLVSSPDESLPRPNAEAIEVWWHHARQNLEPGMRYRGGRPLTSEGLLEQLGQGSMRRRSPYSLELAIRSHGEHRVSTRAFSALQRWEMRLIRPLPDLSRPFARLLQPVAVPAHAPRSRLKRGSAEQHRTQPAPPRREGLAVTGLGMVTSLGNDVVSSCAASRAGVLRIAELDTLQVWDPENETLQPAMGHAAVTLTRGFVGVGRLVCLGAAALRDLTANSSVKDWRRTGLFIALPSSFYLAAHELRIAERGAQGRGEDLGTPRLVAGVAERRRLQYERLLPPAILNQGQLDIRPEHCRLFFEDQIGFIRALHAAEEAIARGSLDRCIVGGVDSMVDPTTLEALDNLRLLRTPTQPARLLPGEGAAFLLVERGKAAVQRGASLYAWLAGASAAKAEADRLSGRPSTNGVLADAIRATLGGDPASRDRVGWLVGDLNGDERRALEWGITLVRLRATHELSETPHWHVAESFGALGAATGPAAVCMVARAFARHYAPSSHCVVWLAADAGARGALHVSSTDP